MGRAAETRIEMFYRLLQISLYGNTVSEEISTHEKPIIPISLRLASHLIEDGIPSDPDR